MLRLATWKIVSIVGVVVLAVILVAPRLLGTEGLQALASRLPPWAHLAAPTPGVDVQGGSRLVLAVDCDDVRKTMVQALRDDVMRILREEKVTTASEVDPLPRNAGVRLRIQDAGTRAVIMPKLRQLALPSTSILGGSGVPRYKVGDDGAASVRIDLTEAGVAEEMRRAADQSIDVIRRRVDALGATEPPIERQGDDRILVEMQGLADPRKLRDILGATGKMTFQLVAEPGEDLSDVEMLEDAEHPGEVLPVEKRVMVEGWDLVDAQPSYSSQTQRPIVDFRFNLRGAQRFAQATSENVGRRFAIVLDGKVISAPKVVGPITGGAGEIFGNFTVEQVRDLAILLRTGALPAKLVIVEERTIEPGGVSPRRPPRAIFGSD